MKKEEMLPEKRKRWYAVLQRPDVAEWHM